MDIFFLIGGPVSWLLKKQDIVVISIIIAEYYTQYYTVTEFL